VIEVYEENYILMNYMGLDFGVNFIGK